VGIGKDSPGHTDGVGGTRDPALCQGLMRQQRKTAKTESEWSESRHRTLHPADCGASYHFTAAPAHDFAVGGRDDGFAGDSLGVGTRSKAGDLSRAVLSLDEVFQGCSEGRVRNAVFGNNGSDVAVRSHVEGDVGGADVRRRANAG